MANKEGLWQRIKVCAYYLASPKYKNILTVSCEICDSTNIKASNRQHFRFPEPVNNDWDNWISKIVYTADYKCQNCGATCKVNQTWKPVATTES